jgi:hypothetical protein
MLAQQTDPLTAARAELPSPPTASRWALLIPVVVWGVWAAMVVALLAFVTVLGRNVPVQDDWDVLPWLSGEQPVELSWLWQHYHEHRIPLPKLIWLVLGRLTACDMRAGIYLEAAILVSLSAALMLVARRLRGRTALADAFFPVAVLHWGQHQTLLWNFELQFVCSTALAVTVLLTLVSVRGRPTARQGLVIGACLLGLPLCGANGLILVPPLALWLTAAALSRWRSGARRDGAILLGLVGSAAGLVVLSFVGEKGVGAHPPSPSLAATMETAAHFFVMAVGPRGVMTMPFSALAFLLLVVGCVLALVALRRRPEERWRVGGLLVYLGAFLVLGLAVGWGRAGAGGVDAARGTRFVTLALPLLCWCFFVAVLAPAGLMRFVPPALCAVTLALLPLNVREGLQYGEQRAGVLDEVRGDIRKGASPEALTRQWSAVIYPGGDPDYFQGQLEWLQKTGQGPYKGRPQE